MVEIEADRVRTAIEGLDAASAALAEAREICDEIGEAAEEERHDCSMGMGIIEEVTAVLEPWSEPPRPGDAAGEVG